MSELRKEILDAVEAVKEQEARQKRLELAYRSAGRQNWRHPMHSTYTGLFVKTGPKPVLKEAIQILESLIPPDPPSEQQMVVLREALKEANHVRPTQRVLNEIDVHQMMSAEQQVLLLQTYFHLDAIIND